MTWTSPAYRWLVWLILIAVALQFLFAGLGVMGDESLDPHRGLASLILLLSIALVVLAFLSGQLAAVKGMCGALLVLVALQYVWAAHDLDPAWLRSLHVFDAFLIAGLNQHLAMRAGWPLRARS